MLVGLSRKVVAAPGSVDAPGPCLYTLPMPLDANDASSRIREALLARDQSRLDAVLIEINQALGPSTAEALARSEFDRLPPDVSAWWLEPCDRCPEAPGHTHN